jgi:thioredoxin-related protein
MLLVWAGLTQGFAAELVMYERPGCPWCVRWHKEVGSIYPKTPEGERAPLRALMLDRQSQTAYRLKEPVFYTPTFVLVEKGEEIGRITGYMGDDAFWSLMKMLAGKLDSVDQAGK